MEKLKNYVGKCIKLYSISYNKTYYIPYGFFIPALRGLDYLSGCDQKIGAMLVNINDKNDSIICTINDEKEVIKIVDSEFYDFPFSRYRLINDMPSNFSFLPDEIKDIRVDEVVRYIKKIHSRRMRFIYNAGLELFSKLPMYEKSMRRLIKYYLIADKYLYYTKTKE